MHTATGEPVRSGLLFYLKTGEVSHIMTSRDDIQHLVMQRNELASHLADDAQLPPMLQSTHVCGRCYQAEACMVAHKVGGARFASRGQCSLGGAALALYQWRTRVPRGRGAGCAVPVHRPWTVATVPAVA